VAADAPLAARAWMWATLAASVIPPAVGWIAAPAASGVPSVGLAWLLFVGSSVHVTATAWLFAAPEFGRLPSLRRVRFGWVPLGLVGGSSALAVVLPPATFGWILVPFFGWQFVHYQRQNLGIVALVATALGIASPSAAERDALRLAGYAGALGLLAHPALLALHRFSSVGAAFAMAAIGFAAAAVRGAVAVARRPAGQRPAGFVAAYLMALLFFLPVFVFRAPYAAVGGLVIAHGLQYLLLVGLVASGGRPGIDRLVALAFMVAAGLIAALLLSGASHLHDAAAGARGLYGAYLGVVMSHFVIDGGVWRLRDPVSRRFLSAQVPFLVAPATDGSGADILSGR
jgi:hypothetical protein